MVWEKLRVAAIGVLGLGIVHCAPFDDDDSGDLDEPTPPVETPDHFSWGDAVVCDDPVEGWEGRFSEEGASRGLTWAPPGQLEDGVYRGTAAVAVSDLDLDGDLDFIVSAVVGLPRVFLNDGVGNFSAGPTLEGQLSGPPGELASLIGVMDVDDDPFPELLALGRDLLIWDDLSDGLLQPPVIAPLSDAGRHAALMLGDADNDGDLDVGVGTYFRPQEGPGALHPELLLLNDDGFGEVRELPSATGGVHCQTGVFTDRDFDGDMDLFIPEGASTGTHPTAFFRNDGGEFTDDAADVGVDVAFHGMGVASWDWNGDGWTDYCVTDVGPSICFISDGEGGYFDASTTVALRPSEAPFEGGQLTIGWSLDIVDLDHDGHPDAVQASAPDEGSQLPPDQLHWPDLIWSGTAGEGFTDVTEGSGFGNTDANFGLAAADFDGDGAQDVVVVGPGVPPRLYMNRCSDGWIEFEFEGAPGNADAVGAIAWVDGVPRELQGPRSFGQRPSRLHFGLGHTDAVEVRIQWPDGTISALEEVPVDRLVTVRHPDSEAP